jgi:hypothetical protein
MNKTGESSTSVRRLVAAERHLQALELRKVGKSFPEIARELGYGSASAAYDAVMHGLRLTFQEPADEVRRVELERCDKLLAAVWPMALRGDLQAVASVLRVMERRAKYLGLDAPVTVDIGVRIRAMAEALGLDADAAVAEAERLLTSDHRHHATPR